MARLKPLKVGDQVICLAGASNAVSSKCWNRFGTVKGAARHSKYKGKTWITYEVLFKEITGYRSGLTQYVLRQDLQLANELIDPKAEITALGFHANALVEGRLTCKGGCGTIFMPWNIPRTVEDIGGYVDLLPCCSEGCTDGSYTNAYCKDCCRKHKRDE